MFTEDEAFEEKKNEKKKTDDDSVKHK